MLRSFHDGFVGGDQGRGGGAAGSMFVDECIDYQLDVFWPLEEGKGNIGPRLRVESMKFGIVRHVHCA